MTNTSSQRIRYLPTGQKAETRKQYLDSWRKLGKQVESLIPGSVYVGGDPNLEFRLDPTPDSDTTRFFTLPVDAAISLIGKVQKLKEEVAEDAVRDELYTAGQELSND
jgi:hypothetical protein